MKAIKKLLGFFWNRSLLIFLVVGGVNTVLSWLASFALAGLARWDLYFSTLLPYAVLSVPSFYFNRRFSFKSKAPLGSSILRFTVIIIVCFHLSFLLNNLVVPWMRGAWFPGISDTWYTALRLVGIQVVFTLLNYAGQRLWAFRANEQNIAHREPEKAVENPAENAPKNPAKNS